MAACARRLAWLDCLRLGDGLDRFRIFDVVIEIGVGSDEGILRSEVHVVEDLPVDLPNSPCRVEEALECVR